MAYTYDPIFAADPNNAANVAANASIIIFDPADEGKAPITITDVTGSPLPNPITVNRSGFGPAFQHPTLDRVGWFGAGFSNYFTAYEGIKDEAVAARVAAQAAAATAGADAAAVATAAIGTATDASTAAAASAATAATDASASATAAANAAALVGTPADTAIAAAINGNGATKTALSATYGRKDSFISVRDHGAVGDGVANDNAAIQAAINAAETTGGNRVVLVPPGTYLFTSLVLRTGVTLQGAGGTLKFKSGTCVNAGTAYYPIITAAGASNVSIIGLTVDANGANNGSGTLSQVADTITIAGENQRVEGCTLLNAVDSGIMFSQVKNSICRDNRISGGNDVGIYVNDGVGTNFYDNIIEANRITGFPFGGIALKRISSRCVVASNIITDCGNGITLEHASTSNDYSTNMTIVNNRMRNITGTGIDLRGCANVICSGNRIEDHLVRGIYAQGCVDSVISGNVVNYVPGTGDAIYGTGIYISDRAAWGPSARLSVTGNVVRNPKMRGIEVASSATYPGTQISIVGNTLTGCGSQALTVRANNTGLIVVGNTLGGTTYDVEWFAGATGYASNNNLLAGAVSGAFRQTVNSNLGSSKTGTFTTALRPSAVTCGDGAQIYDTDLNKPLWSDGAVWKDSAGTTV